MTDRIITFHAMAVDAYKREVFDITIDLAQVSASRQARIVGDQGQWGAKSSDQTEILLNSWPMWMTLDMPFAEFLAIWKAATL